MSQWVFLENDGRHLHPGLRFPNLNCHLSILSNSAAMSSTGPTHYVITLWNILLTPSISDRLYCFLNRLLCELLFGNPLILPSIQPGQCSKLIPVFVLLPPCLLYKVVIWGDYNISIPSVWFHVSPFCLQTFWRLGGTQRTGGGCEGKFGTLWTPESRRHARGHPGWGH